ncbi:hypothetical protein GALMADRAFT_217815 [Galerina marginata CBS 339.88]|uniref:RBR-type E3 ubiquitin transferase n=1 Tax=Galerina marginata (strain CBS 339.88) TaxID=685588 RepID=A0A067U094_GALM3|nr:hypothetical protein GALMADRAFT_217815 [Galerina marginata CBS 339.88]
MSIPLIDLEDLEGCRSLQQEELEVLEAIYPECIASNKAGGFLNLEIPIEFGTPRILSITGTSSVTQGSFATEALSLTVLPPVILRICLPPLYPLYDSPEIVSIRTTHGWLPNAMALQDSLFQLWESGESVLYKWVEYVRTGDFLQGMERASSGPELILDLPHASPTLLASLLSAFDTSFSSAQFSQNSYPCAICLTHLKGIKCLQLGCKHIFCRSCLEDFWQVCIAEGDVGRVGCPDPNCVKEGRESCEEEVARVVSDSELERWKWLRIKRHLELDPTTMACPVPICQTLVPKPGDADPESGWDRFRQCPRCSFSFCSFCKYTWHGPISACPIAHKERLIQEYLATDEGSKERHIFEARYGRSFVLRLVAQHEQEIATTQWISSSTTLCPGCESPVEKSEGCNHMTCSKCRKHFCYRCGMQLDPLHPYDHFSVAATRCFNKLFDWVDDH